MCRLGHGFAKFRRCHELHIGQAQIESVPVTFMGRGGLYLWRMLAKLDVTSCISNKHSLNLYQSLLWEKAVCTVPLGNAC